MDSKKEVETHRIASILDVLNLSIESLPVEVQENLTVCTATMERTGVSDPNSAKVLSQCAKKMIKQVADIKLLTNSRSREFDMKKLLTSWNNLSKQLEKDIKYHEDCASSVTTASKSNEINLSNCSENELLNRPHVKVLELMKETNKAKNNTEVTRREINDPANINEAKELLEIELNKYYSAERELNELMMGSESF